MARPLKPGMRTSSKTQEGDRNSNGGDTKASNASALPKVSLGRRRVRSSQASASRTLASSSTIYTVASGMGSMATFLDSVLHHGRRQGKSENRSAWLRSFISEETAVLLDHRAAQTEPQAHALFLGREEGREELPGNLFGNALTAVAHRKFEPSAVRIGGGGVNAQRQHFSAGNQRPRCR